MRFRRSRTGALLVILTFVTVMAFALSHFDWEWTYTEHICNVTDTEFTHYTTYPEAIGYFGSIGGITALISVAIYRIGIELSEYFEEHVWDQGDHIR
jgi:hypothetical protein